MVVYCLEKDCFKQDQRGLPFCQSANHLLMNQNEAEQLFKRTAVCELLGEAFRLLRLDLTTVLKRGEEQFGRKAGMSRSQQLFQRSRLQKKYELSVMQGGLATFLQKVQKVFECQILPKFEEKLINVKNFRKKVTADRPRQQSISTHQLGLFKKEKRLSLTLITPPNLKLHNRPKIKKERLGYPKKKQSKQAQIVNQAQLSRPVKNQRILSASLKSSSLLASELVQTRIFEIAKESLKNMLLEPQKYIKLNERQKSSIQRKAQNKFQIEAFVMAEAPPSPQQNKLINYNSSIQKQPTSSQPIVRKPSVEALQPELPNSIAQFTIKQSQQSARKEQLQITLGKINILTQPVRIGTTKLKSLYLDFMVFAVLYKTFFLLRTELNQPSLSEQNSKIETAMKKVLAKVEKDYRRQRLFAAKSFVQIIPCVFPLLKQHWLQINRIAPRHPQKRLEIQQYLLMLGSSVLIIHDNLPEGRRILFNESEFLSLKSSVEKRSYIDKGLQGMQSQLNLMRFD